MRVKLPPRPEGEEPPEEDPYVDVAMDSEVRAEVDDEFNTIWNSLVVDINSPLKRLRAAALLAGNTSTYATAATNFGAGGSSATMTLTSASSTSGSNRNDNTVTLIKNTANTISAHSTTEVSPSGAAGARNDSAANVADCLTFIEGLTWESHEFKEEVLEVARRHDQQLLAFYRSLKGIPSSFIKVATKYVKYSKAQPSTSATLSNKK